MRKTINSAGSPNASGSQHQDQSQSQSQSQGQDKIGTTPAGGMNRYEEITDPTRLERLIKAKEKTRLALEQKVGWVAMEKARAEQTDADEITASAVVS